MIPATTPDIAGPLTFDPTYKYQPGTDVYDTRPDKKIRAPAWCDRVLWKTHPGALSVQQLDYRCAQLNPSDHKPVSALFSCGVRTIVEERKKVVFRQLIDVLKKHNSNELPKVEVKGLQIKLDRVCFEEPVVSHIDIVNQGQSIAHWRFVPKLNEDRICKRWISVDTESGLLLPGESIRVAVTVQVDTQSAHALNAGKDVLEDLIVIRIEQSVDFHVIVSAVYQRSCFGVSLMELVRTSDAVANTVQLTERAKSAARAPISTVAPDGQEESEEMSVPKELWRLVDGLWSGSALKEKDLFNSKSDPQEVTTLLLLLSTSDMMNPVVYVCSWTPIPHRYRLMPSGRASTPARTCPAARPTLYATPSHASSQRCHSRCCRWSCIRL